MSRIGRRLLGWFVIVALIPLLFMGYQGYLSSREAIEEDAFRRMETIAATKVARINQWFDERDSDLELMAANVRLLDQISKLNEHPNPETVEMIINELENYRSQSQAYKYICLYDPKGQPWCCTEISSAFIKNFDSSDLFHKISSQGISAASAIRLDPEIGPVMQMAVRLTGKNGSTIGILVATLALSETLDPIILDSTGLGKTGEAYIVNADRWMLTPSRFMNHPKPLTHTMDSYGIREGVTGKSGSAIYKGWYGEDVLGSWVFMPKQHWVLLAEISAKEAFASLVHLRRTTLLVAALTLLAVLMIVYLISRSISRPIRELAAASREIAEGNLERTAKVETKDELGELAGRFNSMVQSLKAAREKEKLAAIGEMTASIVHEIRNPLSSVKMNLQILEAGKVDDTAKAEHLSLAKSQTARLEGILNELLEFSKPLELQRAPANIRELLQAAISDFKHDKFGQDVVISGLDELQALSFSCDAERLRRALLNILLNAGQAMRGSGTIHVSAELSEDILKLAFRDNGPGISDETLVRIFEPFFTTRSEGTGLGLSYTQKIVQAHGGELKIQSEVGSGTTVSLIIPEYAG